jgi:hypothetical protein
MWPPARRRIERRPAYRRGRQLASASAAIRGTTVVNAVDGDQLGRVGRVQWKERSVHAERGGGASRRRRRAVAVRGGRAREGFGQPSGAVSPFSARLICTEKGDEQLKAKTLWSRCVPRTGTKGPPLVWHARDQRSNSMFHFKLFRFLPYFKSENNIWHIKIFRKEISM